MDVSEPFDESKPVENTGRDANALCGSLSSPKKNTFLKLYNYLFLPCRSRLAMKVFDSVSKLNEEQNRQAQLDYFIIHPCSRFKFVDFLFCVCVFLNIFQFLFKQSAMHATLDGCQLTLWQSTQKNVLKVEKIL